MSKQSVRPQNKHLIPFKKADARINRKGRPPLPQNFAEYRRALIDFLNAPTKGNKTRLTAMWERMLRSHQGQKVLMEYAAGKVPQALDLNVGKTIEVKLKDEDES